MIRRIFGVAGKSLLSWFAVTALLVFVVYLYDAFHPFDSVYTTEECRLVRKVLMTREGTASEFLLVFEPAKMKTPVFVSVPESSLDQYKLGSMFRVGYYSSDSIFVRAVSGTLIEKESE